MILDSQRLANLAENPYAGQGAVLLDVGGDIGAIVLHLSADHEGLEVEIESPHVHDHDHEHDRQHTHAADHGHPHRPHVAVVGRPTAGGLAYSAVFPDLRAGRYRLSIPGHGPGMDVDVRGGQVTEALWDATP